MPHISVTFSLNASRSGCVEWPYPGTTYTAHTGVSDCDTYQKVTTPKSIKVALFQFDTSSLPSDAYITGLEFYQKLRDVQPMGEPEVFQLSYYLGQIIGVESPTPNPELDGNSTEYSGMSACDLFREISEELDDEWIDLLEDWIFYEYFATWDELLEYLVTLLDRDGVTDVRILDTSTRGTGGASWGTAFNKVTGTTNYCKLRVTYLKYQDTLSLASSAQILTVRTGANVATVSAVTATQTIVIHRTVALGTLGLVSSAATLAVVRSTTFIAVRSKSGRIREYPIGTYTTTANNSGLVLKQFNTNTLVRQDRSYFNFDTSSLLDESVIIKVEFAYTISAQEYSHPDNPVSFTPVFFVGTFISNTLDNGDWSGGSLCAGVDLGSMPIAEVEYKVDLGSGGLLLLNRNGDTDICVRDDSVSVSHSGNRYWDVTIANAVSEVTRAKLIVTLCQGANVSVLNLVSVAQTLTVPRQVRLDSLTLASQTQDLTVPIRIALDLVSCVSCAETVSLPRLVSLTTLSLVSEVLNIAVRSGVVLDLVSLESTAQSVTVPQQIRGDALVLASVSETLDVVPGAATVTVATLVMSTDARTISIPLCVRLDSLGVVGSLPVLQVSRQARLEATALVAVAETLDVVPGPVTVLLGLLSVFSQTLVVEVRQQVLLSTLSGVSEAWTVIGSPDLTVYLERIYLSGMLLQALVVPGPAILEIDLLQLRSRIWTIPIEYIPPEEIPGASYTVWDVMSHVQLDLSTLESQ